MDFDALAERLGIDREDFIELSELFVTTTEADMERIRQGMTRNSPSDAAAAAHSIKGAAANLGFEEMAELAKTMEFKGKDGDLDGFSGMTAELGSLLGRLKQDLAGE